MNRSQRVLVVDDEPETVRYVSANLKARGFEIVAASDGTEALKQAEEQVVDLILLDLTMPGPDGFEVCRRIRETSDVPIIVLSARGREQDKVKALDMGADDYMTKPFGIDELLARVRAALRRTRAEGSGAVAPLEAFGLRIDFSARQVVLNGRELKLTPTEYSLLAMLARNAGKVLTHRVLLNAVWGPEYGQESEYLWAYIRRLRKKLEPDEEQPQFIITEPGVGYRFRSLG
ncbi:MAG: response regulator transcription factor [Chloroflexi bacterium]|nr:response regulator transcription factor [Chloroflexota bacterium]